MKNSLLFLITLSLITFTACGNSSSSTSATTAGCLSNSNVYQDTTTSLFLTENNNIVVPRTSNDWNTANNYCSTLNYNNCTGWRLPTRSEMQSLYNNGTFTNTLSHWTFEYWVSDVTTSVGFHECFDVGTNLITLCANNAPIGHACVIDY
jgi:hypothetical protein